MILLLASILSFYVYADAPLYWSSATKISERHEFYENDKNIEKPQDTWQVLFAVIFPDSQLLMQKDCVLYRVPGAALGELKLKRVPEKVGCETVLFSEGEKSWKDIKSLTFSVEGQKIFLTATFEKYKTEAWKLELANINTHPEVKIGLSSALYKAPSIILLAPETEVKNVTASFTLKDGDKCHEVSDDCDVKESSCLDCPSGWYEIPNGCSQGPKFCGSIECGTKNAPACRRGMQWQRLDKKYSCREDSSFAYCSPGLRIQCEGALAFCR